MSEALTRYDVFYEDRPPKPGEPWAVVDLKHHIRMTSCKSEDEAETLARLFQQNEPIRNCRSTLRKG